MQKISCPPSSGSGNLLVGGMMYTGAGLQLVNLIETKVPFATIIPGFTDGIENTPTNSIIVPNDGFYHVNGSVYFDINEPAVWDAVTFIKTNPGATYHQADYKRIPLGSADAFYVAKVAATIPVNAGDTIEITCYATSVAPNFTFISGFTKSTQLTVHKVR